jgi:thioredoxin-related protein
MLRHVALVAAVALAAETGALAAESIQWKSSLDEAKKEAAQKKTFMLVYLSSGDCPWCRKLEAETLPDAKVVAAVSEMAAVKLTDAAAAAFAQKYGLQGVPHTAVLTSDEKLVTAIVGFVPPENFVAELGKAKEKDAKFNELSAKVEANPKDLDSVLQLAGALMERRSLAEARKQFDAARALDADKKQGAKIDLGVGIILAETGDMAGAEKLLSGIPESYAQSPEAPQALYVVGIIQARQKRMEDALKSFKRIVDEYKESPWAQAAQRLIQMIMTGAGG